MRLFASAVIVTACAGCGDDGAGTGQGGAGTTSADATGTGSSSTTATTATGAGGGSAAAELLYDGPVGGQLPGWDPSAPFPLVALGEVPGGAYWMTLLSVADDGTLGDNLSPRVIVWGWRGANAPPAIYDGPVGGQLPGWDAAAPAPLVALAGSAGGGPWTMTLLQVGADGTLSQNVAERLVLWAFPSAGAAAYDGPVGGMLLGWSSSAPVPLAALGKQQAAAPEWLLTLLQVGTDGTLSQNTAAHVAVWKL